MTPGLAFFYGGLLRKKNIINMMAMCFVSIAIVSVIWFFIAYSLAFAPDMGGGIIGGLNFTLLSGVDRYPYAVYSEGIPHMLFMVFQLMFAIITVAIIASPFSERVNFGAFCIFISIWLIIVYSPIAHWVWGDGGWLGALGALDFAGGTVVHINVGFAALAVALVIGPREGYQKEPMEPSNIPFILLGTGLLWLGWFGFNGGSALAANEIAVLAMFNTHLAASAGAFIWMLIEYFKTQKFSTLSLASGALAGLVAVTPAAGFVEPWAALIIGASSSIICFIVLSWRANSRIDESLDAISIHGTGGIWGAVLTGIFASVGASGVILGNFMQLWIQIIGVIATIAYAFIITFILAWIINKTIGFRVPTDMEYVGLDISQHGEKI
jgi:Amt family ammonium transporter